MKAYTLRLDTQILDNLKYISLQEKKSIRQILIELIEQRLNNKMTKDLTKQQQEFKKISSLLNRISSVSMTESIREDRHR